jgi:glycosyltransferase involved in cell wall biosynthesis
VRVLLTTHQFFPDFSSGTEVLTLGVAKELMRRGHSVRVFSGYPQATTYPDESRCDQYEFENIRVYRFHHSFAPMGGQHLIAELEYNNVLANRYLARILAEWTPDLVHFFHFSRLGTGLIDVILQAGIPGFYTPTDFWAICPTSQLLLKEGKVCDGPSRWAGNCVKHIATRTRHGKFKPLLELIPIPIFSGISGLTANGFLPGFPMSGDVTALSRRLQFNVPRLNSLKGVLAPTRIMGDMLRKFGVRDSLIEHVSYGIGQAAFSGPQLERKDGTFVFGFIGSLARHKGCHVLINAFRQLSASSARLRIYGKKDDYPEYVKSLEADAQGDPRIEFLGAFPNEQIGRVLGDIDALVVPSVWYENAPLVVYSALAAKCPVVASNFPGMTEMVRDGDNGLLFEPGDVGSLLAQLRRLASDPPLLQRLRQGCATPKSIETYVDELFAAWRASTQVPANAASRNLAAQTNC